MLMLTSFIGSAAAWAQRFFWGANIRKGSWFAWFQSKGMKGVGMSFGSLLAVVFSIMQCRRRRRHSVFHSYDPNLLSCRC